LCAYRALVLNKISKLVQDIYHTIGILKDRGKPLQIIKVSGQKHGELSEVIAIEHSVLLSSQFS